MLEHPEFADGAAASDAGQPAAALSSGHLAFMAPRFGEVLLGFSHGGADPSISWKQCPGQI